MSLSKTLLVFDISNMLYRTFFANKQQDDVTAAGLAHHMALVTLNKYYKQFKPKPDRIIMAFDRNSWRKEYTADESLCLSGKPYKGQRRVGMTPKEREKFELFLEHLREFEELVRTHTSIVCLAGNGLEADDLVAGVAQAYYKNYNVVVVSSDKDFIQLLRYPNVKLVDPASGEQRTLEEWGNDADLFIFEKCLRGDVGDNVQSAYPRIRKTKIIEAYNDPFQKVNLMNDTWVDQNKKEHVVKHLFEENKMLMDLTAQPECVRRRVFDVIDHEMDNPGTFSYFHFMKFLGKYELKRIAESLEQYVKMLSTASKLETI